jgi:hypothetical protein
MAAGTFNTEHKPKESVISPYILYKMRLHQTNVWNTAAKHYAVYECVSLQKKCLAQTAFRQALSENDLCSTVKIYITRDSVLQIYILGGKCE